MAIRVLRVGLLVGAMTLASCAALFGFEELESAAERQTQQRSSTPGTARRPRPSVGSERRP